MSKAVCRPNQLDGRSGISTYTVMPHRHRHPPAKRMKLEGSHILAPSHRSSPAPSHPSSKHAVQRTPQRVQDRENPHQCLETQSDKGFSSCTPDSCRHLYSTVASCKEENKAYKLACKHGGKHTNYYVPGQYGMEPKRRSHIPSEKYLTRSACQKATCAPVHCALPPPTEPTIDFTINWSEGNRSKLRARGRKPRLGEYARLNIGPDAKYGVDAFPALTNAFSGMSMDGANDATEGSDTQVEESDRPSLDTLSRLSDSAAAGGVYRSPVSGGIHIGPTFQTPQTSNRHNIHQFGAQLESYNSYPLGVDLVNVPSQLGPQASVPPTQYVDGTQKEHIDHVHSSRGRRNPRFEESESMDKGDQWLPCPFHVNDPETYSGKGKDPKYRTCETLQKNFQRVRDHIKRPPHRVGDRTLDDISRRTRNLSQRKKWRTMYKVLFGREPPAAVEMQLAGQRARSDQPTNHHPTARSEATSEQEQQITDTPRPAPLAVLPHAEPQQAIPPPSAIDAVVHFHTHLPSILWSRLNPALQQARNWLPPNEYRLFHDECNKAIRDSVDQVSSQWYLQQQDLQTSSQSGRNSLETLDPNLSTAVFDDGFVLPTVEESTMRAPLASSVGSVPNLGDEDLSTVHSSKISQAQDDLMDMGGPSGFVGGFSDFGQDSMLPWEPGPKYQSQDLTGVWNPDYSQFDPAMPEVLPDPNLVQTSQQQYAMNPEMFFQQHSEWPATF